MSNRRSTVQGGPPSGIIMYLDSANPKSYNSGSTLWNDLSNYGNNGLLVNGPSFDPTNGGSIVFDGIDDRVDIDKTILLPNQSMTILSFIKPNTTRLCALVGNRTISNTGWAMYINRLTQKIGFTMAMVEDYVTTDNNTVVNNVWQQVGITISGTILSFYRNGIFLNSVTMGSTIPTINEQIAIGSWDYGINVDPYDGRISMVQICDRALNQLQILQNYNTLKYRYL